MTIERGRHGSRVIDPLVCRLVARALKLPEQQAGVVLGIFRDQYPQRDLHRRSVVARTFRLDTCGPEATPVQYFLVRGGSAPSDTSRALG